jgi:hypothetical protein
LGPALTEFAVEQQQSRSRIAYLLQRIDEGLRGVLLLDLLLDEPVQEYLGRVILLGDRYLIELVDLFGVVFLGRKRGLECIER